MAVRSAGLLLYRSGADGTLEVLIAHMGGPFWARKDDGAWSIIKGEHGPEEDPLHAALREFQEETGAPAPAPAPVSVSASASASVSASGSAPLALGELRQRSDKVIAVWALESDFDADSVRSNTFTLEWPRGSGRTQEFPEIDRAAWFDLDTAARKLLSGQVPFVERLAGLLAERARTS